MKTKTHSNASKSKLHIQLKLTDVDRAREIVSKTLFFKKNRLKLKTHAQATIVINNMLLWQ